MNERSGDWANSGLIDVNLSNSFGKIACAHASPHLGARGESLIQMEIRAKGAEWLRRAGEWGMDDPVERKDFEHVLEPRARYLLSYAQVPEPLGKRKTEEAGLLLQHFRLGQFLDYKQVMNVRIQFDVTETWAGGAQAHSAGIPFILIVTINERLTSRERLV